MEWTVGYAGACRFITSDRPVVRTSKDGTASHIGLTSPNCEITFPLSKAAILQMRHIDLSTDATSAKPAQNTKAFQGYPKQQVKVTRLDDAAIQHLNEVHASQAYRYVFSGIRHDRVRDLMQRPAKGEKRSKTLVEADVLLESGNFQAHVTRKREFIVEV